MISLQHMHSLEVCIIPQQLYVHLCKGNKAYWDKILILNLKTYHEVSESSLSESEFSLELEISNSASKAVWYWDSYIKHFNFMLTPESKTFYSLLQEVVACLAY